VDLPGIAVDDTPRPMKLGICLPTLRPVRSKYPGCWRGSAQSAEEGRGLRLRKCRSRQGIHRRHLRASPRARPKGQIARALQDEAGRGALGDAGPHAPTWTATLRDGDALGSVASRWPTTWGSRVRHIGNDGERRRGLCDPRRPRREGDRHRKSTLATDHVEGGRAPRAWRRARRRAELRAGGARPRRVRVSFRADGG